MIYIFIRFVLRNDIGAISTGANKMIKEKACFWNIKELKHHSYCKLYMVPMESVVNNLSRP